MLGANILDVAIHRLESTTLGDDHGLYTIQTGLYDIDLVTWTRVWLQESYVVSRIHWLIGHSTARQTPCLPTCKGSVSHVSYECTQFTTRHHLLYSNLIPQHPVPLVSTGPNVRRRTPIPFSKTVPYILGNSFVFLSFFVDPWLTEDRIFHWRSRVFAIICVSFCFFKETRFPKNQNSRTHVWWESCLRHDGIWI